MKLVEKFVKHLAMCMHYPKISPHQIYIQQSWVKYGIIFEYQEIILTHFNCNVLEWIR